MLWSNYCNCFLPLTGKKFQNVAKEGLQFADEGEDHKEQLEQLQKDYEPLTKWLKDTALSNKVGLLMLSIHSVQPFKGVPLCLSGRFPIYLFVEVNRKDFVLLNEEGYPKLTWAMCLYIVHLYTAPAFIFTLNRFLNELFLSSEGPSPVVIVCF